MSQPFYKLQATGNDFIFFLASEMKEHLTSEKIVALCARQTGVGADGVAVLHEVGGAWTHKWDFYNSDGGEAEMCGNAARCATLLLEQRGAKHVAVQTRVGGFKGGRAADGEIEVIFDIPAGETKELTNVFGQFPRAYLTNTGVPHCVIPVEKPWDLRPRAKELAPFIFDKLFLPNGSNLTFVNWGGRDAFETVTLERGVNDFTLSCGTGVIAAAKVFADLNEQGGWRKMKAPGGTLSVFYLPGTRQVHLKGPASLVFKGEL
jgi:diaminopimelate epimerase